MTAWNPKANAIFLEALETASFEERGQYLDRACGSDVELRSQVEELLAASQHAGSFLEHPPVACCKDATAMVHSDSDQQRTGEEVSVAFLSPSTKPGALGRLGHYEILQVVGRGGMGVVLKAFDEQLHRVVALKALSPALANSASSRQRFLREARAAAAVCHDHVVTIHAVVPGDQVPYLVMQFVAGKSLQQKLDELGSLSAKEILRIGLQIASGLAAAHKQGLIHRDIKPANILLENGIERVKITDFGLARTCDDVALTQSGVIAGTPTFMSPEQAEGLPIDHRSDLFSLGAVMYATCTGQSPFQAPSTVAVLKRVCTHTPRPIREVNPDIPEELCVVISRLLAKVPADRYATANEVAETLSDLLSRLQQPTTAIAAGGSPAVRSAGVPPATEDATNARVAGETPALRTGRTQRRTWVAAVILVLLTGLGLSEVTGVTQLAGTAIRLWTPEGTLVVETNDPNVSVTIDGQDLVITGAGAKEVRLKTGQYKLTATKDGKVVRQELVTIARNGREIAKVGLEQTADGGRKETTVIPDLLKPEHGWVSLLPLVNTSVDHVNDVGRWTRNKSGDLEATHPDKAGNSTRLRLPVEIEGDYEIEVHYTRKQGPNAFYFDIPISDRRVALFNGDAKNGSGLALIDGKEARENGTMQPFAIQNDRKYVVTVRLSTSGEKGKIETTLDGKRQVSWEGKLASLEDPSGWFRQGALDLSVAPNSRLVFHDFRLRMLTGEAKRLRPDDSAWIRATAALPAEKQLEAVLARLKELNPDFNAARTHHLVEEAVVTSFHLHPGGVKDIRPLRALTGLRNLSLRSNAVGDLTVLAELSLIHLDAYETRISDLRPLGGMPLRHLVISVNAVTDLTPLAGMPLEVLSCNRTRIRDLTALKGMKLRALDCSDTAVTDLTPLESMPLTELMTAGLHVTDLKPLRGMRLTSLTMDRSDVTDLSPLKGMPLKGLNVAQTKVTDFSVLEGMPLEYLEGNIDVERDGKLLRSLPSLKVINGKPKDEFLK